MKYISCILVFLVPLYFINNHSLFSFSAPKMILIIGFVLLITVFYFWGILAQDNISFRFTPIHIVLGIFLLILTLSSLFGVDPLNSFFGKWIDGINLILVYAVTIFALLVGFLIKKDKSFIPRIMLYSFISSVIVAIISFTNGSIMSILKGGDSTIGNNSYTGAYLLFNLCFGVGLLLFYSKIWQRVSITVGSLIILLSPVLFNIDILMGKVGLSEVIHKPFLLFGEANAVDVGLFVSLFVFVSFFLIFSSKKIMKIVGVVLLSLLLVGILYTSVELRNPTTSLHKVYLDAKGDNRFVTWDIAEASIASRPLLGSGFNNFAYTYQKYFTPDILEEKNPEFYFYQPHNVIWEYASNDGVFGLLAFFLLLAFTFSSLFVGHEFEDKKYQYIRIALIATLFGYFIQNLFGFDTPVTYLMLFLLVGLAVGVSKKEWNFIILNKNNDTYKFIASLFIVVCLISSILFVVLPLVEFKKLGRIISANTIDERISQRDGVSSISLFGGIFDSSYLAGKFFDLYQQDFSKINDSNKDLYLKEIQSTVNMVEKDIVSQPNYVYSYITMNSLLNMELFIKGETDTETWNYSFDSIQKAIKLNPQNPENYLQLAQTYILKEDFSNAYLSVREAIIIAPKYSKSYDYARKILKIKPNDDLEKYVDNMEKKWVNNAL